MRKGDINKERKTLLTLCQNRESSLSPKEHPYSLKMKLIPTSSNQIHPITHPTWRHQGTIQD